MDMNVEIRIESGARKDAVRDTQPFLYRQIESSAGALSDSVQDAADPETVEAKVAFADTTRAAGVQHALSRGTRKHDNLEIVLEGASFEHRLEAVIRRRDTDHVSGEPVAGRSDSDERGLAYCLGWGGEDLPDTIAVG